MSIDDSRPAGDEEALASAASHWFARMRGPDADDERQAFEAWLAERPEHRRAYAHAAEIFAMGKLLAEPREADAAPEPRRNGLLVAALAVAAAAALVFAGWTRSHELNLPEREVVVAATIEARDFVTVAGEARTIRLADGSTVHLSPGTELSTEIGNRERRLTLMRGTARFEVAHEGRPFVVYAGGGTVTARGTVFDVSLARSGKVDVRLLQGAVDVSLPKATPDPTSTAGDTSQLRRLKAGERLSFAGLSSAQDKGAMEDRSSSASAEARDFDSVPVSEVIALANRDSARPIRLADPSVAAIRVSGRLRVDDTELLARRLGALLDQEVRTEDLREIVLVPGRTRR